MTRNREKVIDLLVKLKAMADESKSRSPEEAAIAATQMQKLMFEHKIGMAELDIDGVDDSICMVDMIEDSTVVIWKLDLAGAIARSNFCQIVYGPARRARKVWMRDASGHVGRVLVPACKGTIELFGKQSDIDAVLYLYQYLCAEINRLAKSGVEHGMEAEEATYRNEASMISELFECGDISTREHERRLVLLRCPSTKRKWLSSFRTGCALVIANRLYDQRKRNEAALRMNRPQCTALVRKADAAVDAFVTGKYPRLGNRAAQRIDTSGGYAAGKQAGEGIALGGGKGLHAAAPQLTGKQ